MIALSIRQPWAWLIVHGFKPVENRVWSTPFRGPCLIHAGKTLTAGDYEIALNGLREALGCDRMPPVPPMHELPLGGFVGAVRVVDCVQQHPSPYFTGPHGFVMEGALALPFQPYRGLLNFFNVGSDVLRGWPGYRNLLEAGRTAQHHHAEAAA